MFNIEYTFKKINVYKINGFFKWTIFFNKKFIIFIETQINFIKKIIIIFNYTKLDQSI